MDLTDNQHRAVYAPGNVVAAAGAGSGKTRVLVERYVRLISEDRLSPDAVLAITFTEKAAREMRERVQRVVAQRARQARDSFWEELRAAVESARIGTIHSFCAELLRAHPAETGLDPRFRILDEVEAGIMLADSVDEALRGLVNGELGMLNAVQGSQTPSAVQHSACAILLDEFGPAELRAIISAMLRGGGEVRSAVQVLPAAVDALSERWRIDLEQAQAKALAELLRSAPWCAAADEICRLDSLASDSDKLGVQLRAVANWLAHAASDIWPDFALIDAIKVNVGSKKLWPSAAALADAKQALVVLRELYRASADILAFVPDPQIETRAAEATIALRDIYALARRRYSANKARADALDFDDLEARVCDLLLQHPHVRRRWWAELSAIMVDEFQDTNEVQRTIIYALAGLNPPAEHTPPAELFVVGDGKQSIYRFRGADVSVFRHVEHDMVARGGQRISLDTSFRTHPSLLGWMNLVSAHVFARDSMPQSFEIPFEPLQPSRLVPPHSICVELHISDGAGLAAERRTVEAALLARRLRQLVDGAAGPIIYDRRLERWRTPQYADIAILFRASSAFDPFEAALRGEGIPFLTTAGRGYYGRSEVRDLIHLLRVIDEPSDELALVGALRSPLFALSDATIIGLRLAYPHALWAGVLRQNQLSSAPSPLRFAGEILAELQAMRGQATVAELLRAALDRTGYLATISGLEDGERRRVNVEKLVAAARLSGARGLRAFSEYLEQLLRAETREGEAPLEGHGSVRLMTIHRSKGLEFPLVALPDLGRTAPARTERWLANHAYGLALQVRDPEDTGCLPTAMLLARRVEAQMERAESDRLLYVAMTRAEDYLLLSGPALKKAGASWIGRIAAALDTPWESGGPPCGLSAPLAVFRHDEEQERCDPDAQSVVV
ncbi:MAG: UvrD-helicase domain-containing protein [Oscillochloris sp.]|nr:UvrD-helicase domain-containing protein [Oscillochloris sp.]